jgi:hypothetical protein
MKKFKNIKLLSFLLILGVIAASCVQDDDFNVPDMNVEEPNVNVNTDILSVKAMHDGYDPVLIQTGDGSDTEMYLEAYVISDDESGNIYKQMFIQDSPENPTAGVVISTNATDLYTKYGAGQKIYFRVNGLYIGKFAGLPSIGVREGNEIGRIGIEEFQERILRSTERAELVPTVITMSQIGDASKLATLVKFENVQFPSDVAGIEHYGNLNDTFGVNRRVENCDGNNVIMRTSGFADFKNMTLPAGNGSLTSILSIFNNDPQVIIRNTDDVQMDGPRCGEDDDDDDNVPGDALPLPFKEKFEGLVDYDPIALQGWTNQDVSGSSRKWESRSFDGNGYAQLTAYNANSPVETWLITPGIDLTSENAAKLSFDTKDGHYTGEALSVYISTDFNGNATSATWTQLNNVIISSGHTDGYGASFISSGNVDLAQYLGQVIYVGFKYAGSNGGVSTTIQLDNVSVSADGSGDDGGDPDEPNPDAAFAFAGADFENWQNFLDGLNDFGIKPYATQGVGTGRDGSASLKIATTPTTTDSNDYVFTATAIANLPTTYSKISFYIKGTADKSVSFNIYKTDGTYYAFNLGDLTTDAVIPVAGNNQYAGSVNTGGQWRLVSLDLSAINDINVTDTSASILALKIGKNANYDLHFDNFTIE